MKLFSSNVGGWDRGVRLALGVLLLVLGFSEVITGAAEILGYVVAAVALVTAFVRFCPANALLGINTCKPSTE